GDAVGGLTRVRDVELVDECPWRLLDGVTANVGPLVGGDEQVVLRRVDDLAVAHDRRGITALGVGGVEGEDRQRPEAGELRWAVARGAPRNTLAAGAGKTRSPARRPRTARD